MPSIGVRREATVSNRSFNRFTQFKSFNRYAPFKSSKGGRCTAPHGCYRCKGADRVWHRKLEGGILRLMSKPAVNIADLNPEERLRMIEELWDSLSEQPGSVPLTDAQRQELDRRLDDLECSGPTGIPWEEVLKQIRSRSR